MQEVIRPQRPSFKFKATPSEKDGFSFEVRELKINTIFLLAGLEISIPLPVIVSVCTTANFFELQEKLRRK